MNPTPTSRTGSESSMTQAAIHTAANPHAAPSVAKPKTVPVTQTPKPSGYGLPCSKCRTYYTADLPACPVCKSKERVSPTASPVRTTVSSVEQNLPDPAALEEERERFLREFQTHVLASQSALNPATAAARCLRGENHPEGTEPAAICQSCYDQLQDRVDVLEAALHMDTKEAAQIVYDAVWADPSDTDKTYQNAASALLAELRKRSGVTPTFRPLQSMLD